MYKNKSDWFGIAQDFGVNFVYVIFQTYGMITFKAFVFCL